MSRKLKEPFVRMAVGTPRNTKLLKVPPAARWLWFAAICHCREQQTDGFLERDAISTLGVDKPWALVAQLVAARLFVEEGSGYRVHDYTAWQETKAEVQERRAEVKARVAEWRGKQASNA